jgi:hypothetical protein
MELNLGARQFNTTTSMGGLTLNMLLSFAQFEREVTGERIRDKIAASKKKGMWMGGTIPLGYEPDGRSLKINDAEAKTVRTLFRLYIEQGTVRRVKEEADRLGLTTKVRVKKDGTQAGGKPFSRGYIYKLLGNPLYIGRIPHKGDSYEGLHPAIVNRATWDDVQTKIAENQSDRESGIRQTTPSPLAGKIFDADGTPLTPTHAVKSGRRYRYYVSRHLIAGTNDRKTASKNRGWRLPAGEIENFVAAAVKDLLSDPSALASLVRDAGLAAESVQGLLAAAENYCGNAFELIDRLILLADEMVLYLDLSPLTDTEVPRVEHRVPLQIRKRGVEMKLVLENGVSGKTPQPDLSLIKAVTRAHRWMEALRSGHQPSQAAIADVEGVSRRYVGLLLPLACLAPDIVETILAGRQPVDLTAEKLIKQVELPLAWAEQRRVLGFQAAS